MKIVEHEVRALLRTLKSTPSEDLESETVEFKAFRDEKALHNSKDLADEISALANHKGGQIVIGVRDSSDVPHGRWEDQLVGFPSIDVDLCRERIAGRVRPSIGLELAPVEFEGKQYLIVAVPPSRSSIVATSSGKVCIREGRSSRPMSPDEVQEAVKHLTTFDWTADPIPGDPLALTDPDSVAEAAADFAAKRGIDDPPEPAEYLEAVGATRNGVLTRAGLLFLGKEREIRERLGVYEFRFSWKLPNGTLRVNELWAGNLWQSVRRARGLFDDVNESAHFKHDDEVFEAPLMDPVAFHEGYLNALVHRDYATDGIVSITYSGAQLTISSPGTFYGGITSSNIGVHEPRHRNKLLAKIMMTHALVDRAGMGVLRMGINSLKYGRSFPTFEETEDTVEVTMEAKYLRPIIAVLALENDEWGIPEMLILNGVYESGVVDVRDVQHQLRRVKGDSWSLIQDALEHLSMVELCGTREGVFIRVTPEWRRAFNVDKSFRASTASKKLVDLYDYLRRHGKAPNSDLSTLLGHSSGPQTSRFLRETKFVKREGKGRAARWSLAE